MGQISGTDSDEKQDSLCLTCFSQLDVSVCKTVIEIFTSYIPHLGTTDNAPGEIPDISLINKSHVN
jgi:hypothetical protein